MRTDLLQRDLLTTAGGERAERTLPLPEDGLCGKTDAEDDADVDAADLGREGSPVAGRRRPDDGARSPLAVTWGLANRLPAGEMLLGGLMLRGVSFGAGLGAGDSRSTSGWFINASRSRRSFSRSSQEGSLSITN